MSRYLALAGYIRGPASDRARRRMSVSQRRRLGIPDGHVQIYGHHVPEHIAPPIRYWAYWIAWKMGRDEAVAFVGEELAAGYPSLAYLTAQYQLKQLASENRELIRSVRRVAQ